MADEILQTTVRFARTWPQMRPGILAECMRSELHHVPNANAGTCLADRAARNTAVALHIASPSQSQKWCVDNSVHVDYRDLDPLLQGNLIRATLKVEGAGVSVAVPVNSCPDTLKPQMRRGPASCGLYALPPCVNNLWTIMASSLAAAQSCGASLEDQAEYCMRIEIIIEVSIRKPSLGA